MLIIPVSSNIGWKNPPVATIVLIVLNCFIFLMFQTRDDFNMGQALEYYVESGLAGIEVPRYIDYCAFHCKKQPSPCKRRDNGNENYRYAWEIETDREFIDLLHGDDIITPQDPAYDQWKNARITFESKLKKVVYWEHGFRPAFPEASSLVTHMFLHGGIGHLIGNMLFLWFMGCIIELGWGRLKYLTLYLLSGIAAVLLFWAVYSNNGVPLVGASGAIAGLMGALTMLYAGRKIRVFYSVGFYFNYLNIRAWMLFPVWMGFEIYQLVFGGFSNVAYMAHIGGLFGGGTIGLVYRKWFSEMDEDVLREEVVDEISPMIEKALNHMGRLELDEARSVLEDVLTKDAQNKTALKHLFSIDKTHPDQDRFHHTADALLQVLSMDRDSHGMLFDVYKEYASLARPRISPVRYVRLATIFLSSGHLAHAEKIATLLALKKGDTPGVPELLIKVSNQYRQEGMQEKSDHIKELLLQKYPEAAAYLKR